MAYSIISYPARSSVYTRGRGGAAIRGLVWHATAGSKAGDLYTLSGRDPRRQVSVHYYITKTGDIYQLVQDGDTAWHAGVCNYNGVTDWNQISLGVELENLNDGRDPYPAAQLDAAVWLGRTKIAQYRIDPAWNVRHATIAIPPGRKTDPRGFPWEWFMTQVYPPPPPMLPPDTSVIGVAPSITLDQFRAVLSRHTAPLAAAEIDRVYTFCQWLDIDPAFVVAVWLREGGTPLGSSPLQQQSRCPFNLRAPAGDWRTTVTFNGTPWYAFESFQLGLFRSIGHLKQEYGAKGLTRINAIIPVFAPASDNNNVTAYIDAVRREMAAMQQP